jgi:hypothetical protein
VESSLLHHRTGTVLWSRHSVIGVQELFHGVATPSSPYRSCFVELPLRHRRTGTVSWSRHSFIGVQEVFYGVSTPLSAYRSSCSVMSERNSRAGSGCGGQETKNLGQQRPRQAMKANWMSFHRKTLSPKHYPQFFTIGTPFQTQSPLFSSLPTLAGIPPLSFSFQPIE